MNRTQQISIRSSKDEELDTSIDNNVEGIVGRVDISASEATDDPDAMDDTDLAVGDSMDMQD